MSKRTYIEFIRDIFEHIEKIEKFTSGYDFEDFIKDEKTVYAVIRCFEVIGEAVKNLPSEFKEEYPSIPWSKMAGMRDKLIHSYFGVDYETLWETVKKRIPELKPIIKDILVELRDKDAT